jgi:hypothetical protein
MGGTNGVSPTGPGGVSFRAGSDVGVCPYPTTAVSNKGKYHDGRIGSPPSPNDSAHLPPTSPNVVRADASPALPPAKKQTTTPSKNRTRDLIEFAIFLVIFILLLKTFVAEQFVIPTGSMASTLLWASAPPNALLNHQEERYRRTR